MANHENIIVGAANVFIGPAGDEYEIGIPDAPARVTEETLNEEVTEPAYRWENVGLTQGGVEFAYAPDFGEVEVDQWLDVAKMYKQRQSVTVNTTFAEATLENLLFAWGQPTETLDEDAAAGTRTLRISAGSLGDKPQERGLVFVGPAPDNGIERVYHLYRALSVESSSHSLSRSDPTLVPVALRCLPSSQEGGADVDYGVIIERFTATGEDGE